MKNYSYIGIAFIILVFGIIFVPKIIDRVSDQEVVQADRLNQGAADRPDDAPMVYIEINGEKKRAPEFEFINQDGDTISNKDYEGKVYVAEFFFATCPDICPIMTANLVEVQQQFEDNDDFGIVSFTIDPKHDTPEVLKNYTEVHGITHPNWHLLTGEKAELFELANSGFNLFAGEDSAVAGGFAHSGYFALVDKEGYIRSRQDKFGNPIYAYRGSVESGTIVEPGDEEPQIDILIQDIKKLL